MATGVAIGGAVLGGAGQVYGGIQARKAAKKQQRQLDAQARLEREAAEFDAIQAERKFDKLLGTQKAKISGSGVKLEGSPLLLIEETLRDKEETADNIRRFGAARASALQSQAANVRDTGRAALTSSIIGGFGTGLSAASQIGGAAGGTTAGGAA